jgi:hypothetical protein
VRLALLNRSGTGFFVVYNDRRDTLSGQLVERALIVKLTNLFSF